MQQVNFKGTPFFMNGKEYIIPSLSLKQVETNYELLANAANALEANLADPTKTVVDTFKTYIPVIIQAFQRNYPDVTVANLWDWLDVANFSEILVAVQSRSGFKATTTGEALPVAE
jgi:hypothetical protein